jgi:peptidoglycan hydrolase-like protein with peptidoglycan-binding domain
MTDLLPLFLNKRLSAQNSVDRDDVIVTKGALQQLGYYEPWDGKINSFTDNQLFNGIKAFQEDHGLTVDGYMDPEGETATEIGRILFSDAPFDEARWGGRRPVPPRKDPPDGKKRDDDDGDPCWQLLMSDNKRCGKIPDPGQRNVCRGTASARYAACQLGRPLPPLYTGD